MSSTDPTTIGVHRAVRHRAARHGRPRAIQMTAVSLAERGRSHEIRHFKLDARRSGRPTPLGEAPATGLAAVTLNRTRQKGR